MKLHLSLNSPYVRKTLIAAIEAGVYDQIEQVNAVPHPINRNQSLVALNPLGQIPTLELASGEVLADSRVIARYFAALGAGESLYPAGPRGFTALSEEALCDGLIAACLAIRYERATRAPAQQSEAWVTGQMAKIESVLDYLEPRYTRPPAGFDIGHIAVGCALGYLAFRFPEIALAPRWPALAAYWAEVSTRPSFDATQPPG